MRSLLPPLTPRIMETVRKARCVDDCPRRATRGRSGRIAGIEARTRGTLGGSRPVVEAEVGDGLEVRPKMSQQPDHLDVALCFGLLLLGRDVPTHAMEHAVSSPDGPRDTTDEPSFVQ